MPYEYFTAKEVHTGVNYYDILPLLKTFLTSNASLVNAGETWTILHEQLTITEDVLDGQTLIVQSPGYADQYEDNMFILNTYSFVTQNKVGLAVNKTNYSDTVINVDTSPGGCANFRCAPCSIDNVTAFFYANAVTFKVVLLSSTNNHSITAGQLISFSTRYEWLKPVFIMGLRTADIDSLPSLDDDRGHLDVAFIDPDANWIEIDLNDPNKQILSVGNFDSRETDTGVSVGVLIQMALTFYGNIPGHFFFPYVGVNNGDYIIDGTLRFDVVDNNANVNRLYTVASEV